MLRSAPFNPFAQRDALGEALRSGQGLEAWIRRMAGVSLGCSVLYGGVLGVQVGGWQWLASPVKLPLILLGTCGICMAALYVLLALAGARLGWRQVVGLALCSVTGSAVAMAAVLPVAAFWTFSVSGPDHTGITLVHTGAFLAAGAVGTRFGLEQARGLFGRGRAFQACVAWMWVYGLVAQQMAWLFRPHFHPTRMFMHPPGEGGSALESLFRIGIGLFQ